MSERTPPWRRQKVYEMISERSHVDELPDHVLWKLGGQLSDEKGKLSYNWRRLASELGLGKNDFYKIRANPTENPGYEVIRSWSKQRDSTIRVLNNVCRDVLERLDLVKTIDEARRSE